MPDDTGQHPAMHEDELDPQRIAALIDGTLGERERTALLAALAASDEGAELLDLALAAKDAAPTPVQAIAPRKPGANMRTVILLAAAALAFVIAIPLMRRGGSTSAPDAIRFAAALTARPGDDFHTESRPWPSARGGAASLPSREIAVRIGTYVTDIQVAARERSPALATLTAEIAAVLDNVPGGAVAARTYRGVNAASGDIAGQLDAAQREALAASPDAATTETAGFLEATRLAAARRDSAFFTSPVVHDFLGRGGSVVQPIRTATENVRAIDWEALARTVNELQRQLVTQS
jgi:hypothetical protein